MVLTSPCCSPPNSLLVDLASKPFIELPSTAEDFLGWLAVEKGRSPNTLAAYRRDLEASARALADIDVSLEEASTEDLERLLLVFTQEGWARSSLARLASTLRGFFRFAVDEGSLSVDPTADLGARKTPVALPKALTEEQISSLLDSLTGVDALSLRDRAIIEVLYATGARVSEVIGLNLGDVDRSDGLLLLRGKGNRERVVPLGSFADTAIERWLRSDGRATMIPAQWKSRSDEGALFLSNRGGRLSRQSVFALLNRRAKVVGLEMLMSPHVLRHSCATHLLAHGADIRIVQELLGHRSIATTQRYTKVDPTHLRQAVLTSHPRGRPMTSGT